MGDSMGLETTCQGAKLSLRPRKSQGRTRSELLLWEPKERGEEVPRDQSIKLTTGTGKKFREGKSGGGDEVMGRT